MAIQTINIGNIANDGTGDDPEAFTQTITFPNLITMLLQLKLMVKIRAQGKKYLSQKRQQTTI